MSVVRLAEPDALARISYPGQGTVIAIDPDIPPERQRVALQLSGPPGNTWLWRIDNEILGSARRQVLWRPRPGQHRLALLERAGGKIRELEAVHFEVRTLKGAAK
jgi:penicillin-binding protein 1C